MQIYTMKMMWREREERERERDLLRHNFFYIEFTSKFLIGELFIEEC